MKKRILSLVLSVALCASLTVSAFAAESVNATVNRTVKVTYNGVEQAFANEKGEAVYPVVYNSTTYLPIRAVSNLLGLGVKYENGTVVLTSGGEVKQNTAPVHGADETVVAELNRDIKVTFDGAAKTLVDANGNQVYPIVYQSTIYVPLRAVSNLLNLPVDYKDGTVILGTAPTTPPVTTGVSDNWLDLEFALDGVKFAVPFNFQTVKAQGWSIAYDKYKDFSAETIIEPGKGYYGTIELTNPKYHKYFTFWVGFKNNTTTNQTIENCDVWTVKLSNMNGYKLVDSYPEVTLAKGITWGTDKATILAALGEPKETYESTFADSPKYTKLTYQYKYDKYFILTVYDDFGLTNIDLKNQE